MSTRLLPALAVAAAALLASVDVAVAAEVTPVPEPAWTAPDPSGAVAPTPAVEPAKKGEAPVEAIPSPADPPPLAPRRVDLERRNLPLFVGGIIVASVGIPFLALGVVGVVVGGVFTIFELAVGAAGPGAPLPNGPKLMLGGLALVGIGAVPAAIGAPMILYGGKRVPPDGGETVGEGARARTRVAVAGASPLPALRVAPTGASATWTF